MKKILGKLMRILAFSILLLIVGILTKLYFFGKVFQKEKAASHLLPSSNKKNIKLTFLGTSCFILDYKGKQFVSDPFFSNQDFPSIIRGKTPLEKLTNYLPENLYKNVTLISVTHGHFDHCLDIGTFLKSSPAVVADSSVFYQLHQLFPKNTIKHQLHYTPNEKWIYSADSTFRVYTILSHHGPHVANTVLFDGSFKQPLSAPPHYLWEWQLGSGNYSFLVDVLDEDSIVFRMALLSGNIDESEYHKIQAVYTKQKCDIFTFVFWKRKLNEKQIDLGLKYTNADIVLLNHWNNFFCKQQKPLESIRSSEILEVLNDHKNSKTPVYIMLPFTSVEL